VYHTRANRVNAPTSRIRRRRTAGGSAARSRSRAAHARREAVLEGSGPRRASLPHAASPRHDLRIAG
jgi:hypothetical protein